MQQKLPIGESDFKVVIEQGYTFVDKSLLIKDVVEAWDKVLLIPRPRRFGKTLNMRMLYYFFSHAEEDAWPLFQDLAVAQHPEIMEHRGKYPVAYFNLKGIRGRSWEVAKGLFEELVSDFCQEVPQIAETMNEVEHRRFSSLAEQKAEESTLRNSLRRLAIWMHNYYQQPVVLLIDEYDTPILEAHANDYYDEMISFMRSWLGEGLKLEQKAGVLFKAVVTGIMRVAKESQFSGLNNFGVYPLHQTSAFEGHFGFTQSEVEQLLTDFGLADRLGQVQEWYNGYELGNTTLYNPWSIINYIARQPNLPEPYWLNTSSNELVRELLTSSGPSLQDETRADFEKLLKRESVVKSVSEAAVLKEVRTSDDLWSFLLSSGYLTASNPQLFAGETTYELRIPNLEVGRCFSNIAKRWLAPALGSNLNRELLLALLRADWPAFERSLQKLILNLLSCHDLGKDKPVESVLHAFVLGLIASLAEDFRIRSNREEGEGRADIVMSPFDRTRRGYVIEFKTAGEGASLDDEGLEGREAAHGHLGAGGAGAGDHDDGAVGPEGLLETVDHAVVDFEVVVAVVGHDGLGHLRERFGSGVGGSGDHEHGRGPFTRRLLRAFHDSLPANVCGSKQLWVR